MWNPALKRQHLLYCFFGFFYCYRIAIFDYLGSVTCEMIELKYGTIDYDGNREVTYNGTTPCRHLRTKQEGRCWITYNEIRVNCAYVTSVKLKKSPKPPAVCTAFSTYMATLSQHDLHGHVAFCAMSSESYIPVQHDAFDWLFWQHFWTRQIKIQIQMGICRALLTNCPGALTKCQNAMWNRWDFRYVFWIYWCQTADDIIRVAQRCVSTGNMLISIFTALCLQLTVDDTEPDA